MWAGMPCFNIASANVSMTPKLWVYSARVKAAEDQLKLLKNKEQNAGTAKCSLSEHLVINFDTKAILLAQQVEVAQ